MNSFYCACLYSKCESYYFNNYELAYEAMIEKEYSEGDVIYLMRINESGEYVISEVFYLPLSKKSIEE